MNTNAPVASRLFAMLGAFAITASLLLGSFSTGPTVQSIAGVIA